MNEAGELSHIQMRMEDAREVVSCIKEDEFVAFGYKNIFSLFVLLCSGLFTAAILCLLERLYKKPKSVSTKLTE